MTTKDTKQEIRREFDAKFLYRLNQIALHGIKDVALYADQEAWLSQALDTYGEEVRREVYEDQTYRLKEVLIKEKENIVRHNEGVRGAF